MAPVGFVRGGRDRPIDVLPVLVPTVGYDEISAARRSIAASE